MTKLLLLLLSLSALAACSPAPCDCAPPAGSTTATDRAAPSRLIDSVNRFHRFWSDAGQPGWHYFLLNPIQPPTRS